MVVIYDNALPTFAASGAIGALALVFALVLRRRSGRTRLPRHLDPDLRGVHTHAQLLTLMSQHVATMPALLPRQWSGGADAAAGSACVRVLQFNTLARGLSSAPHAPTPFAACEPSNYGGFDAIEQPACALDWSTRKWRVLQEALRFEPDIVALEEVDQFHDFFGPALDVAGYEALHHAVADAPGLRFGYYSDGVVLAWRRDKLRLGSSLRSSAGRASIVATLEHTASRRSLVVACTHLSAKTGQPKEDRRTAQVRELLREVEGARAAAAEPCALVVLGDLNTDPHSVSHPSAHVAKAVPLVLERGLSSAYPLSADEAQHALPTNQLWTTWKRRGKYEARHQIDYVLYAGARCVGRLEPPCAADVGQRGLPSPAYPSDHIALAADLELDGAGAERDGRLSSSSIVRAATRDAQGGGAAEPERGGGSAAS